MEPFASLAGAVRSSVPRLLVNRDLVGPFAWRRRPQDVVQLGDVVGGVQSLVDALGWTQELDALMAAGAEKVSVFSHLLVTRERNALILGFSVFISLTVGNLKLVVPIKTLELHAFV